MRNSQQVLSWVVLRLLGIAILVLRVHCCTGRSEPSTAQRQPNASPILTPLSHPTHPTSPARDTASKPKSRQSPRYFETSGEHSPKRRLTKKLFGAARGPSTPARSTRYTLHRTARGTGLPDAATPGTTSLPDSRAQHHHLLPAPSEYTAPMSTNGGADEQHDIAMGGDESNNAVATTPQEGDQVNSSELSRDTTTMAG